MSSRTFSEKNNNKLNIIILNNNKRNILEISFWNKMFLCSIKTGMFTVAELLLSLPACKRQELQTVQRHQQ